MASPLLLEKIFLVDLLRLEILKHLDLSERQPIRQLSKSFKRFVDEGIIVRELVVKPAHLQTGDAYEEPDHVRSHRWYSTTQFADQKNFVPYLRLPAGHFPQPDSILAKLHRLRLGYTLNTRQLVELSGHLTSLRHLDIARLNVEISGDNQVPVQQNVDLCGLRVLCIKSVAPGDEDVRVTFQSPELSTVCLGKFELQTLKTSANRLDVLIK